MASRSIKEFPILISDNIEPETAVMLKKLMEEQYAEYINLLISNQVVNLADYRANDEDGNIAIQALDTISGSNFKKSRVPDEMARTNSLNTDTVFQNFTLYNLLRENEFAISSKDTLTDALLEGAVIVPSEAANDLVEFIQNNCNEIVALNEVKSIDPPESGNKKSLDLATRYGMDIEHDNNGMYKDQDYADRVLNRDKTIDAKRGFLGMDIDDDGNEKEIYMKLTTGDVVLDKKRLDQAINRSVGEILTMPENAKIRDRFEKATFLLQSRRIAGIEYYNYLTLRLGIPVSDAARKTLIKEYKIGDIRKFGQGGDSANDNSRLYRINSVEVQNIANNRNGVNKIVKDITTRKASEIVRDRAIAAGASASGAGAGLLIGLIFASPLLAPTIIGAAIGGSSYLLYKLYKNKKYVSDNSNRIQGWERVENLIIEMEKQQADILGSDDYKTIERDIKKQYDVEIGKANKFLSTTNRSIDFEDLRRVKINDDDKTFDAAFDEIFRKDEQADLKDLSGKINALKSNKKDYINQIEKINKPEDKKPDLNKLDGDEQIQELKYRLDELRQKAKYVSALKDVKSLIDINLKPLNSGSLRENEEVALPKATYNFCKFDFDQKLFEEAAHKVAKECCNDKQLMAEVLSEKVLATTSIPVQTKYVEKKADKNILVTPSFMARDVYAYGTTEIDRRDIKDRKYNQPLIMTIKFKERFDDGKYSDNELTAVIGILGRIIRIPTAEMEYILKQNAEGNTVEGIFGGIFNSKNSIDDLLSTSKVATELKNLPQSADIWKNLEKVSALAVANKMSGRRNGNVANAHIVFAQREVDAIRNETGVDYLKDPKKSLALMKRYSAFTLMVANDASQRVYIMDDQDNINWNVVPYAAFAGKDSGEQLNAALTKMMRL